MNYRHIYHAGNFADVFKHILLVLTLEYLKTKDKPFFFLDTHAGIGLYDLHSEQAGKTKESEEGIGRVARAGNPPEAVRRYLDIVRGVDPANAQDIRFYPGSPLIARALLRPVDRMVANELHPDDNKVLFQAMGRDARVRIEQDDGYAQLRAKLPPHERRGLVLTDPPFEVRNEFELLAEGLKDAHKRWATGIYAFWYPVKDRRQVEAFHRALQMSGIPKITAYDFMRYPDADPDRFNGCGMAMVNPPWTLARDAATIGPWLVDVLTDNKGRLEITELTGE